MIIFCYLFFFKQMTDYEIRISDWSSDVCSADLPILRPRPAAKCRSVGPFVFFDHMLQTSYKAGQGMNIRQHPHIGLSTLTYLFEGKLQHKDSLGSDQIVDAGDVSWMTAGSAIAHVERTPETLLGSDFIMHGLQVWLASPQSHEQGPGHYSHHPAHTLPVSDNLGVKIRMIAGSGFCLQSPVPTLSPTLYAELHLQNATTRPEARSVGEERARTCRRGWGSHILKKQIKSNKKNT